MPEQIDAVVCSHAHIDHVWGIIGGDGKPNFPNAQVFLSKADFDYWTDEGRSRADGWLGTFVQGARRNLLPVRERLWGRELARHGVAMPQAEVARLARDVATSASTFQSPTLNLPFRPPAKLSMFWIQRVLCVVRLTSLTVAPTT